MKTKFSIVFMLTLGVLLAFSGAKEIKKEVGHKAKLTKQDEIVASFVKLEQMVLKIGKKSKLTLYEGLPHQMWDQEQLETELANKVTVTRFGFPFYLTPNEVSEEDTQKLVALIQSPKSFVKFGGFKACGGFHPDFAIVWKDGKDEIEIHVCFGCHEIKVFRKDVEVYCDIRKGAYDGLSALLKKYNKQRPKPR